MANKRKPLGYTARQVLAEIDLELANGDIHLTPLVEGELMLKNEIALRAALASRQLREARRKLQQLLSEQGHDEPA